MQAEFWHQRWASDQIGFHLKDTNPYLQTFWPQLSIAPGAGVLVPLCGKSLDLAWLAGQGYRVRGIELSEKAVEDFFAEHQLQARVSESGSFKVYAAGQVELWCGDFFNLTAQDVESCVALYDRAALIALPPPMRQRYVEHLHEILPEGCQGLLITLDYDQSKIEGPPFSVPDDEVQRLLGAGWQVEALQSCDVLEGSWKFVQRGVSRLEERVYRLVKRQA
jgi:thiopurine S-methyltransferase